MACLLLRMPIHSIFRPPTISASGRTKNCKNMDSPGIEPGTSRRIAIGMRSEHYTPKPQALTYQSSQENEYNRKVNFDRSALE